MYLTSLHIGIEIGNKAQGPIAAGVEVIESERDPLAGKGLFEAVPHGDVGGVDLCVCVCVCVCV